MKRFLAIFSIVLLGASLAWAVERPNILVIVADDLGYGDIGVQGRQAVPTPNIDALAASGIRCTNGYVSAPYCSPSRAGLLTGRYQTRFGHEFNPHDGDPSDARLAARSAHLADLSARCRLRHRPGRQMAPRIRRPASAAVARLRRVFRLPGRRPQLRAAQGRQDRVSAAPFAELDLSRPRAAKARRLHDRPVHRRSDRLHRIGTATIPGSCTWPTMPSTRRWRSWKSIKPASRPTSPTRIGAAMPRCCSGSTTRSAESARICADSGQDKNTLIFFFSDNGGSGQKRRSWPTTPPSTPRCAATKLRRSKAASGCPFFVSWARRAAGRQNL